MSQRFAPSADNSEVSRAEIESYQRKLNEVERASQSRIRDFNTTLQARNREYDQLGERLERLRAQLAEKDAKLAELKGDLENTGKRKVSSDTEANQYREQLGEAQIELKELKTRVATLKSERDELSAAVAETGDVEKQLADFTASTEETSRKFEQIIVDQRKKISDYESRIQEANSEHASQVAKYDAQIESLSQTLDDTQSKQQAALAEVNRLKSEQLKKDSEISGLSKELQQSSTVYQSKQAEVLQLKSSVGELDVVRKALRERQAAEVDLSKQLEETRKKQTDLTRSHVSALGQKDNELNKLKNELKTARASLDAEKARISKIQQEADQRNAQLAELGKQSEADKHKYTAG